MKRRRKWLWTCSTFSIAYPSPSLVRPLESSSFQPLTPAVNSIWLIDKVRVVASMLLDALSTSAPPSPSPIHVDENARQNPSRSNVNPVQRAQTYLCMFHLRPFHRQCDSAEMRVLLTTGNFLHILSEIEGFCGTQTEWHANARSKYSS